MLSVADSREFYRLFKQYHQKNIDREKVAIEGVRPPAVVNLTPDPEQLRLEAKVAAIEKVLIRMVLDAKGQAPTAEQSFEAWCQTEAQDWLWHFKAHQEQRSKRLKKMERIAALQAELTPELPDLPGKDRTLMAMSQQQEQLERCLAEMIAEWPEEATA